MTTKPKIGDHVVFNKLPDAVVFTVTAVDGFIIEVVERGTQNAPQRIDADCVAKIIKDQSK